MSEWQSIQTAPNDEPILGWDSFMDHPRIVRGSLGSWRDDWDGTKAEDITHWMPLPERPKNLLGGK